MKSLFCLLTLATTSWASTTIPASTFDTDQTWDLAGSPYIVEGRIQVKGAANPLLTIEAGVEVRFQAGATLEFGHSSNWEGDGYRGQLLAVGTALEPIRFVADAPGLPWGGVRFFAATDDNGAVSQLEHVLIEEATLPLQVSRTTQPAALRNIEISGSTGDGVLLENCVPAPRLEDVDVHDCAGYPLTLSGSGLPVTSGFTAGANGDDRVRYTGTIDASLTLDLTPWPHTVVFTGRTIVKGAANPLLMIPAGTELRFLNGATLEFGHSFNWEGDAYRGQLLAQGTDLDPVRFVADNPGTPWGGLRFFAAADDGGAVSQLEHARIEGATTPLVISGSTQPSILQDVEIADAGGDGILLENCVPAPDFVNVDIHDCAGHPLTLSGSALPDLTGFTTSANGDDRPRYTGTIDEDLALNIAAWPSPLVFSGRTIVKGLANPRLLLYPGTELRFLGGATLEFGQSFNWDGDANRGQLTAVGSAVDSIHFVADDPASPWGGLRFYNATDFNGAESFLDHVVIENATTALRLSYTSQPATLSSIDIRGASENGIWMGNCIPAPALDQVSVTDCAGFPLVLSGSELPSNTGFVSAGNGDDRTAYTGVIESDVTLDIDAWPYPLVFTGRTIIRGSANPRLTIPAGNELRFLEDASLEVGQSFNWEGDANRGQLNAVGTVSDPIRFVADSPAGTWNGLTFFSASDFGGAVSELEHAFFENATTPLSMHYTTQPAVLKNLELSDATGDGLWLGNCVPAPAIENVLVQDCAGFPLVLSASALPTMSGFTAIGNGDNRAAYTGVVDADITLDVAAWNHPLVFSGRTIVRAASNPRLTFPAGSELRFLAGASLEIGQSYNWDGDANRGQLTAVGTALEPIHLLADDPANGWNGVSFFNASDFNGAYSEVQHVTISGAANNLRLSQTDSPNLRDLQLEQAAGAGLSLEDAYPAVERCWLLDNGTGIYLANMDTTIIGDTLGQACSFLGNRDWDLFNDGEGDVLARHNGWCTPDGGTPAERIHDQLDDPAKGLVTYNPTGAVGLLRVTAELRLSEEVLHLEWCPLIGASVYTLYGVDAGYPEALPGNEVASTMDTFMDLPINMIPAQQFYFVTAELPAAAAGAQRGACR